MSTFRQWFRTQIIRLDGTRERRGIALGAMAVLLMLVAGPRLLRAAASIAGHAAAPAPTALSAAGTSDTDLSPSPATPPPKIPPFDESSVAASIIPQGPSSNQPAAPISRPVLTFLFPLENSEQAGPVRIGARIDGTTAVGAVFTVRDANGGLRSLPAISELGIWNAEFNGAPGAYVISARASLENGFVSEFEERRGFRVSPADLSASGVPIPQDETASMEIRLRAPTESHSVPFAGVMPLSASVKNALPEEVVFLVRDEAGAEITVSATATPDGGLWNGLFAGPDGGYDVRARATVGGVPTFSESRHFLLQRKS